LKAGAKHPGFRPSELPGFQLRILYFADIRFPLERANGIQTMETCWALAERGHRVHLVVRPDTQTPARDPFAYYGRPVLDRLAIERAPVAGPGLPDRARRIGYLAFAAGRAISAGRSSIVMTRDLTAASMLLGLPWRGPLVYESHGYAPDVAAALPELLSTASPPGRAKIERLARREARVWKGAEGYVTITAGLAESLEQRFGRRGHLAIVPDGTRMSPHHIQSDCSRPDADEGHHRNAAQTLTIGYAGHLYPWKGVDVLLEALARLPGVQGLVVGGLEKEEDLGRARALAARLGLQDRVAFCGQIPPTDVPAKLARAHILVLPNPASAISSHATSPLKLFEYMAARKAIVASDLPAIREVLTHELNGLLVAPGDVEALANGIRRLADDADLRERLAEAASQTVAEYSWGRRAERLEKLFTEVLAARRMTSGE
jgi:glycosyltransferase involved in cell wall biosynthesis